MPHRRCAPMIPHPWIMATDGSHAPFGFVCMRCGGSAPLPSPIPMEEYLTRAKAFTEEHKRCAPSVEREP